MKIRKAILLAAGMGTRICRILGCLCKQIIRIRGLELLMYPLTSLWSTGIEYFIVVSNPGNYHILDNLLQRYSNILGYDYILEINPYPISHNGNSAIIGLKRVREPVIISVTDHIYPPELVEKLTRNYEELNADIIVAGDPDPLVVDTSEATKLLAEGNRVIKASKKLENYNYIDMGVFLALKPENIASTFIEEEPINLSDILSSPNIVSIVKPIHGIVWKDVDVFSDLAYLYNSEVRNVVNMLINNILLKIVQ